MKTNLKYYNGKNKYFLGKKIPKESVNCLCITVMALDSACKIKKEMIIHENKKNLKTL